MDFTARPVFHKTAVRLSGIAVLIGRWPPVQPAAERLSAPAELSTYGHDEHIYPGTMDVPPALAAWLARTHSRSGGQSDR